VVGCPRGVSSVTLTTNHRKLGQRTRSVFNHEFYGGAISFKHSEEVGQNNESKEVTKWLRDTFGCSRPCDSVVVGLKSREFEDARSFSDPVNLNYAVDLLRWSASSSPSTISWVP